MLVFRLKLFDQSSFWIEISKDLAMKKSEKNDLKYMISYLPTRPLGQDMTQGQFFKQSLTVLNSEFSFS